MGEVRKGTGPYASRFRTSPRRGVRGFAAQIDVDLSASVVIVYGPNGLGKTSLFDALQWVLLGDLHRLRDARLRQTDEYIVNAYWRDQQARVRSSDATWRPEGRADSDRGSRQLIPDMDFRRGNAKGPRR